MTSLISGINRFELFKPEPKNQHLGSFENEYGIHALPPRQSSLYTQCKGPAPAMPASTSNNLNNDLCFEIEQQGEQTFEKSQSQSDISSFENSKKISNIHLQTVKQEEQKENINPFNKEYLACKEKPINVVIKSEVEDFGSDSGFDSSDSRPDVFDYSDRNPKRKCDFADYLSKKVLLTTEIKDSPFSFEITDVHDKFLSKTQKQEDQDIVSHPKSEKISPIIKSQLISEEETKDDDYQLKNEKVENLHMRKPINKELETQNIEYKIKNENKNVKHKIKNEDKNVKHKIKNEKVEPRGIEHQAVIDEEGITRAITPQIKKEKAEETQAIKYEMKNENMNIQDTKHQIINKKVEIQDKYELKNEKAKSLGTKHQGINGEVEGQGIEYQIKKEKEETFDLKQQQLTGEKSSKCCCIQADSEVCPNCPPSHTATQNIDANCKKDATEMKAHYISQVKKKVQNVADKLSLKGFESSPCFRDAQGLVQVMIQMLMMLPTFLSTFVHSINCTKEHSKLCSMFRRLIHHVVISNHHCALKEVYGHILRLHLDTCSQNDCKFPKCQILRENRKKLFD